MKNATQHAVFLLDENGVISSWNVGGERIFGYTEDEAIGCSTTIIFTEEDLAEGRHVSEMRKALKDGYAEDDRWHLRKDGSRFWASGTMTPVYDDRGNFRGYLKITRDKTAEKIASERTLYLAHHDALTGLPNRSMFNEQLKKTLSSAKLNQHQVQVLLLDLDRFKEVNDSYGHHLGDLFLKKVAERLGNTVRASDLVARLGGDEFGIICRTRDGETDTLTLAEKLVDALAQPYYLEDKEIQSGASIGVTVFPVDSRDPGQILKNADLAMYTAKARGRSTFHRYTDELDEDAKRRERIGDWLCDAMQTEGLALHYQPQINLRDGGIVGVEALLRWRDCPVDNVTSPEVVAVAAEMGLAEALAEWTFFTACQQANQWKTEGWEDFRIAINVSSTQLNATSFLKLIDSVLEKTSVPPGCLDIEITEFMLMENNQANDLLFRSLKKKGVYLSVDDFGTGSSSFSSLRNFPVNALKIDREFVAGLPQSEHDSAIASAIIGLAHSLGFKAVAEGVETQEQSDFLAELGCDYCQGYLYGEPLPAEQVRRTPG
ncbi:putative bifunctional diguanylate cyclase/phosphodiesterase [Hydrocarboniclastica marina]|nr:EAL domain-containing protein [Hydrocarboniclastica marina]